MSIKSGSYPSKLKIGKITPIFKSDDESDANNYRPISLLSNFNSIFEKIMYKRMTYYIEQHDLLYPSQYGFRKGHSTQHAMLDIINDIQANMNQRLLFCGVFIDLKKAFDTVYHEILLNKLNHYGFRGIIIDWFSSYLNNRTQTTQVGQHISDKAIITCCVPQGSVLGPLLFLLYVNDIPKCSNKLWFYLFADDTNILYADKNVKALEATINIELGKFYVWLTANKLTLNIKKSNFIAKLRYYVPRKILLNFYKSLIQPYLTYGLPAWGQAGKMYLNKILILQKRALRLLFFADVRDHAVPLFLEANVLPITFLYHECVASLMYDINSKKNTQVAFI